MKRICLAVNFPYKELLELPFLIGALVWFFKITKVVPFESVEVFRKDPFLALLFSLSSLMISLPSSVSCSLYAGDLAIWSSSPLVPTAVEATQGALFRLERWSKYCAFLSIQANVRPPSQWIPTKLISYSAPASVSIPLQLFLGSPYTAHFPFLSIFLRWWPSFSTSQGLTLYLCFLMGPR